MLKNYDKYLTDGIKITSNFHTHNYLCGHAFGSVADYAEQAVKSGLKTLGVSDHFAPPDNPDTPYMTFETAKTRYLPQFDEAQRLYGDKLKIMRGAEIEFFEGYDEYYKSMLKILDYLVMGQHCYMLNNKRQNSFWNGVDDENVVAYCNNVIKGLESGYFSLLAHPDVIFYKHPPFTEAVTNAFDCMIATAAKCGVVVELNANGIRNHRFNYPTDFLIRCCKKHNAKTIVSSDCHRVDELCDKHVLKLKAYALANGLNVVTDLN